MCRINAISLPLTICPHSHNQSMPMYVPLLSQFTFAATVANPRLIVSLILLRCPVTLNTLVWRHSFRPHSLLPFYLFASSVPLFHPFHLCLLSLLDIFTWKISATYETRKVLYKYNLVFEYFLIWQEEKKKEVHGTKRQLR